MKIYIFLSAILGFKFQNETETVKTVKTVNDELEQYKESISLASYTLKQIEQKELEYQEKKNFLKKLISQLNKQLKFWKAEVAKS